MNLNNLKIKSVVFDKEGTSTIICKSVDDILAYEDDKNILIKIGAMLDGSNSVNDIYDNLRSQNINISKEDIIYILENIFIKNDLILGNYNNFILNDKDIIKYDRLIHFFASYPNVDYLDAQKMEQKLFDSNVLILGVGGTGGHTAHSLIASGVGKMTLLDFDKIELTNVTRQMLYHESDIGNSKIEVAKKRLLEINPNAQINVINAEITTKEQILDIIRKNDFDFVVNTMDNPRGKIRYILDDALYNTDLPYIYDGSTGPNVYVGPAIKKGITKSYSELIPKEEANDLVDEAFKLNDDIYITNVIEPLNGTVGQLTAFEVIKHITGCAKLPTWGNRVKLDMNTLEINKYEL